MAVSEPDYTIGKSPREFWPQPNMAHTTTSSLPNATWQFSLRSLLCTIVTISMVLAYVRLFGNVGMFLALANFAIGTVVGVVCGWLAGRVVATLTWTLLGGTLALLCVL